MKKRGSFVVFEGLNAAGKSDITKAIESIFGDNAIRIKHPLKEWAEHPKVKAIIEGKGERFTHEEDLEYSTYLRNKQQDELIIPALLEGKNVIADRYIFTTYAYQMTEGVLDMKRMLEITKDNIMPDLTIYLKVPTEISIARLNKRADFRTMKNSIFDSNEAKKHEHAFEELAELFDFKKVNNYEKPKEDTVENCLNMINNLNIPDKKIMTIGEYMKYNKAKAQIKTQIKTKIKTEDHQIELEY